MKFLLEAEAVEVERDFNSEDELAKQAWKDKYRKERIAKGSGTTVQEGKRLLKQFEESKKMMKMMSNGNMKLPF